MKTLMNIKIKLSLIGILVLCSGWGFFGHENINRLAVFTLPAEMNLFYKKNIHYLVEASVNPDKRRYAVAEEGPRHYIDLDDYNANDVKDTQRQIPRYVEELPKYWNDAVKKIGED